MDILAKIGVSFLLAGASTLSAVGIWVLWFD